MPISGPRLRVQHGLGPEPEGQIPPQKRTAPSFGRQIRQTSRRFRLRYAVSGAIQAGSERRIQIQARHDGMAGPRGLSRSEVLGGGSKSQVGTGKNELRYYNVIDCMIHDDTFVYDID